MKRRRRCEVCGELVTFIYVIERDGLRQRVCNDDLRRGDKVFHGYGKNDFTVYRYQTNR